MVAFGNFTEGGQRRFLDKYGETVGAVVGQLADSGLFGRGAVGQAISASLAPVIADGFRGLLSGPEEHRAI